MDGDEIVKKQTYKHLKPKNLKILTGTVVSFSTEITENKRTKSWELGVGKHITFDRIKKHF